MPRRLLRIAPFFAGGIAAFALLPFGGQQSPHSHLEVLLAALLTAAALALGATAPWERLPRWVGIAPIAAAFAVVGLLRDASGGPASGYAPLVLLPVLWLALHGTRRELLASFLAVAGVFVLPIWLDPVVYTSTAWRQAIVWLVVAPIVGVATHDLVVRIEASAREDPLTRLPNRRAFDERLTMALRQSERSEQPVSVALIDLDGFKAYNDTHGHLAGDRLLVRAASAWSHEVRSVDMIGRIGGDEFVLVLPDTSLDAARVLVERVHAATPDVRCSAGVAEWDRRESREHLLARADAELYRDKAEHAASRRGDDP